VVVLVVGGVVELLAAVVEPEALKANGGGVAVLVVGGVVALLAAVVEPEALKANQQRLTTRTTAALCAIALPSRL